MADKYHNEWIIHVGIMKKKILYLKMEKGIGRQFGGTT